MCSKLGATQDSGGVETGEAEPGVIACFMVAASLEKPGKNTEALEGDKVTSAETKSTEEKSAKHDTVTTGTRGTTKGLEAT